MHSETEISSPLAGRVVTARELRFGMRMNIIAGALGMFWFAAALGIPLTMFMEAMGASGFLIGLTVTVQQLAMVLQIPSALLAERMAVRKPFWGTVTVFQRALWFIPAVLPVFFARDPVRMAYVTVGVVAVSGVLTNVTAATWWSWMADLIPEGLRGSFWGRRQTFVTLVHLLAVWFMGWVLDFFPGPGLPQGSYVGFMIVFALGALAGCADIVVHLWVPEPAPPPRSRGVGLLGEVLRPFRNRDFTVATLAIGVWTFGLGMTGQFSILFLKREFAVTYTQLSATTISASVGVVVSGMLWGYAIDRLGARNIGAITMLLGPFVNVAWFVMRQGSVTVNLPLLPAMVMPQPVLVLLVTNLLAGIFYSAVGLSQVGLMAGLAPREGRTVAMAAHWSVVGLMAALGPLIGGGVMDWVAAHPFEVTLPTGTRLAFFHLLVIGHMVITWCVAVPLLLTVGRRPGEVRLKTAFLRLMVGNPLRAVSSIYNVCAVNMAVSVRKRADAVSRIGSGRAAIAVSDLIASLDDPAAEVREAAVQALGRIGTPEAVDALLEKLNDPHADVMPQIMRALRQVRTPKVVESIAAKLRASDRETVAEAARTLGEIGDARSAQALLDVLQGSEDPKIVSAASEALARLGEMAAIHEIVPRMSSTRNPVLKRSLAVAVSDLLGRPGEFYSVYVREQRSPGSEATRLLQQLCDRIDRVTTDRLRKEGGVVKARIRKLQSAYDEQAFPRCIRLLIDLGIGLAALEYGISGSGDTQVVVESLIWYNQKLGVGLWFLDLVDRAGRDDERRAPDETDALLGIYVLNAAGIGDKL